MRAIFIFLTLVFGIFPSLLLFVWIERNMSLPILPVQLGFPWAHLEGSSLAVRLGFDALLVIIFGIIHTGLAQIKTPRLFYIIVTGITAFLIIAFWQNTGILVWNLSIPQPWQNILGVIVFWLILSINLIVMMPHDASRFLGLSRESVQRDSSTPELIETGFYRYVRHPMYTVTAMAILLTPMMSLDRLFFLAMIGIYLFFAIPIEERKLRATFGNAYVDYRARVPAMIPFTKF
jgi:protein-S-isoprenylcysteine O-methyltransferase Ste14